MVKPHGFRYVCAVKTVSRVVLTGKDAILGLGSGVRIGSSASNYWLPATATVKTGGSIVVPKPTTVQVEVIDCVTSEVVRYFNHVKIRSVLAIAMRPQLVDYQTVVRAVGHIVRDITV